LLAKKCCNDSPKGFIRLGLILNWLRVHCVISHKYGYSGCRGHHLLGGKARTCFITGQMHVNKDQTGNLFFADVFLKESISVYMCMCRFCRIILFWCQTAKRVFEKIHILWDISENGRFKYKNGTKIT
jgi:hypothetical protein